MLIGHRYLHTKTLQPLTLRYFGPLPPQPDHDPATREAKDGEVDTVTWLGVEYDDPAKGRGHSGSYEGVQVFECQQKGAGAFIKSSRSSEQPQSVLLPGKTFIEAVEDRYGPLESSVEDGKIRNDLKESGDSRDTQVEQNGVNNVVNKVVLGSSGNAIIVEAPGLQAVQQRIGRLERLRDVGLDSEWINGIGGDGRARDLIRHRMAAVKVLDLSRNLLNSWEAVTEIVACLPSLQTLVLNDSRLPPIPVDLDKASLAELRKGLGGLRELHLGRSLVSQQEYETIGRLLPNLKVLYLSENPSIGFPSRQDWEAHPIFENLTALSLDSCSLTWDEVISGIGHLPKLESLNIPSNGITSIPDVSTENPILPALTNLTIHNTPLGSWRDLDNINKWTSSRLLHLRFTRTSSLSDDDDDDDEESSTSQLPQSKAKSPTSIDPMNIESTPSHNHRLIVIAKFASLISLNSTTITAAERRDAEVYYMSYVSKILSTASNTSGISVESILADWAGYESLCEAYGRPLLAAPAVAPKTGLRSKMITLKLLSRRSPTPIEFQIMRSAPATLLRKMIGRLLEVKMTLRVEIWTVRLSGAANGETGTDGDEMYGRERVLLVEKQGRAVDYYVSDGDELWVDGV